MPRTLDAERYNCNVLVHFKRHRSRETRKDARSVARAYIATHDKLRAEVAAKRFREMEPIMFAGMAGQEA